MKKLTLALAMLGMSAVAFAGAPGNQVVAPAGVNLIAPDSVGVWSIGLEAMYVEPTNNEFTYAQNSTASVADSSLYVSNRNKVVNQDWQWGGTVDLTYMFPGNSRDVKLAWTHLFSNTSSNTTRVYGSDPGTGNIITPAFGGFLGGVQDIPGAYAKGSERTDYNAVDLVFGQWIKIGDRLDLHPFGGLRWADVDSTFKGRYDYNDQAVLAGSSDVGYGKITSDFDGIGPRAGFDTAVHLGSGFSIVGTFAGSLLIGDINSSIRTSEIVTIPDVGTVSGYQKTKDSNNNTRVVPELDARLGLDYMYAFTPSTSMNVQLGYQVVNYFNVTEADFNSAAPLSSPNTTSSREDWGYQGPYLRLQLNIA